MEFIKTPNQAVTVLYLALQYLSNAARCYLPKKPDNHHLDLTFFPADHNFVVYLSEDSKCVFSFNYQRLTLEWTVHNSQKIIRLNGTSHKQLLKWVRMVAKESDFEKTFKYVSKNKERFPIDNNYIFEIEGVQELERIIHLRSIAHHAISKVLKDQNVICPIRVQSFTLSSCAKVIWPGAYNLKMLFGFAIPNEIIKEHYCYVICYHGNRKITTNTMEPLRTGYWLDKNIRGAILPANKLSPKMAVTFFNEVLRAYRKKVFSKEMT